VDATADRSGETDRHAGVGQAR